MYQHLSSHLQAGTLSGRPLHAGSVLVKVKVAADPAAAGIEQWQAFTCKLSFGEGQGHS